MFGAAHGLSCWLGCCTDSGVSTVACKLVHQVLLPVLRWGAACVSQPAIPPGTVHVWQSCMHNPPFARSATSWMVILGLMLLLFSVCRNEAEVLDAQLIVEKDVCGGATAHTG